MSALVSRDCRDCKHFRSTMVFELCMHKASAYKVDERADQHSVGHMRRHGCGPEARLFEAKDLPVI